MKITKALFTIGSLYQEQSLFNQIIPIEFTPVYGAPLLDYAIREVLSCGIKELVFVVDDEYPILKKLLQAQQYQAHITFIDKNCSKSIAHIILSAKAFMAQDAFCVIGAEDLLTSTKTLKKMLELHQKAPQNIVAINMDSAVPINLRHNTSKLSELPCIKRYILQPEIFEILTEMQDAAHKTLDLHAALTYLAKFQDVTLVGVADKYYPCAQPALVLQANIDYAQQKMEELCVL